MKLLADATLPGLNHYLCSSLSLRTYANLEQCRAMIKDSDILLCRSTLPVNERLLEGSVVRFVATASSGIDHLDTDYLASQQIKWFDAKGCNAGAVADYVMASIAYLQQSNQLQGNIAGIIGLGHVGGEVLKRLKMAGFDVMPYDSPKAASDTDYHYASLDDLSRCDVIMVHANLHENLPFPSKNLLSENVLSQLKPGCVIINAARGGIVDEDALLNTDNTIIYCTDVYQHEPDINPRIVDFATLCTPHIAGHSIEAKLNAVYSICKQLHHSLGLEAPPPPAIEYFPAPPSPDLSWQSRALSIYNPAAETIQLKKAADKKQAFISLRALHNIRHDFNRYGLSWS